MPQAKISVNAVVGSNVLLPINTIVQLNNVNIGGETTYNWTILDQPPSAADVLSSSVIQNPTFTPRKEGTYLIRLIVNQGLPTEQEDRVVCAVRQLKTLERIPAAGETIEADTVDGWATATNSLLRRVDSLLSDPGIIVGTNSSGGSDLTRGQVVRGVLSQVIKAGLPGQETVPGFNVATSATLGEIDELLAVVEGAPDGSPTVVYGSGTNLVKVRYIGRLSQVVIANGPVAIGDTIYVNDAGNLDKNQGTIRRRVGSALSAGSTADVWFNGVGGADIDLTPIDRAYVVYGHPGALPNAFRVDGTANASSVTGGLAFTVKTGDAATVTTVFRRFSGAGLDITQWQDESGAVLAKVNAVGALTLAAGLTVSAGGASITGLTTLTGSGGQALNATGAATFAAAAFTGGSSAEALIATAGSGSSYAVNASGGITAALYGTPAGGPGLRAGVKGFANASNHVGVFGENGSFGTGVYGSSLGNSACIGVSGVADTGGKGVRGQSDTGAGVFGTATGNGRGVEGVDSTGDFVGYLGHPTAGVYALQNDSGLTTTVALRASNQSTDAASDSILGDIFGAGDGVHGSNNGVGTGVRATNAGTGPALHAANSGSGRAAIFTATAGNALEATGGTSGGSGVKGTGGATGNAAGVEGVGGATNGEGGRFTGGGGNSLGVIATGTGTAQGVWGIGGSTDGAGIRGSGTGAGAGGTFVGGTTGFGVSATGNATRAPLLLVALATAPSDTTAGQVYYDSALAKLRVRTAGGWETITSV